MKATSLEQAVRFFDAQKPLSGQSLHQWYVERPYSPRRALNAYLTAQRHQPVKTLLIGHRGNGKSTELNKLLEEISDTFEPVVIDIFDHLTTRTPRYEDLMLTLGTQISRACIDRGLTGRPLKEPLQGAWAGIRNWWLDVVAGLPVQGSGEVETYTNDYPWCDVHVALWDALQRFGSREP